MLRFRKELGNAGEGAACKYLKKRGYRILQRNFTCPTGELDIICLDRGCIVFVEVKTLSDDAAGDPEDNITATKRHRLERAAKSWLAKHREPDGAYRFDSVSVVMTQPSRSRIRHIIDAFDPSGS